MDETQKQIYHLAFVIGALDARSERYDSGKFTERLTETANRLLQSCMENGGRWDAEANDTAKTTYRRFKSCAF